MLSRLNSAAMPKHLVDASWRSGASQSMTADIELPVQHQARLTGSSNMTTVSRLTIPVRIVLPNIVMTTAGFMTAPADACR